MLGFTRSSPLLMTLSAVFVAVAFEKGLAGETRAEGGALWNIAIWTAMLLSFAGVLLFLNMRHDCGYEGALMLSLVTVLVYRRALNPQIIAAAWLAAGGMAAVSFATTVEVTARTPGERSPAVCMVEFGDAIISAVPYPARLDRVSSSHQAERLCGFQADAPSATGSDAGMAPQN